MGLILDKHIVFINMKFNPAWNLGETIYINTSVYKKIYRYPGLKVDYKKKP